MVQFGRTHARPRSVVISLFALLLVGWLPPRPVRAADPTDCTPPIAVVTSIQGQVEVRHHDRDTWRAAAQGQTLCGGCEIRTGALSRAQLVIHKRDSDDLDETHVQLDEHSAVGFPKESQPTWLGLLRGAAHFLSRTPAPLTIKTPYANAKINGTEFLVEANPKDTRVAVFEGAVAVNNAQGEIKLGKGEAAVADADTAPRRELLVKPLDAVQWALHYPPLIDKQFAQTGKAQAALTEAVQLYETGNVPRAITTLDRVPTTDRDAVYHDVRAGIMLAAGRVELAQADIAAARKYKPNDAQALALESVIAVAKNDKAQALALSEQAIAAEPNTPLPLIAKSYAEQAHFKLDAALDSARGAATLAPQSALAWARVAELELSLGELDEAEESAAKARALAPKLARTQTVLGFAKLTRGREADASALFTDATALDAGDPLPRLGLGLTKIRSGQLAEGRRDLESAANIDPSHALVRSYLGKAYFEEQRDAVAAKELDNAKNLDPKDPTAWYYDAIRKQTVNRPIEALQDLQTAMDLNNNRQVYRSKLALDEDLAARGAAIGRVYRELGFEQRGMLEAWKALANDPSDYTAHRLLSDTYSALPRHELGRASELWQSQLLQPLNITPVQPQLAEGDIFLLGGLGPADASLNEFNSLFQRNRFSLLASGLGGNHGTAGDEVVQSGIWDNFSYSLGQMHYATDGFRPNNAINADIYNFFVQARVTPKLSVLGEFRHTDIEHGDLDSNMTRSVPPREQFTRVADTETYKLGFHYAPTVRSDWIGALTYINRDEILRLPMPFFANFRGYSVETQYHYKREMIRAVLGGGYYQVTNRDQLSDLAPIEQGNAYIYTYTRFPANVTWTLGFSVDAYDEHVPHGNIDTYNPKVGVLWNITPDTTFRAAYFKTLKRALFANQTIEPTQVAGFEQFFDDHNGTRAVRFGAGIDHRFTRDILAGFEYSKRNLDEHIGFSPESEDWEESQYRTYLYWTPHPRWAATLEYLKEDFQILVPSGIPDTEAQKLPVSLSYYHPNGLFAKVRTTWFSQDATTDEEDLHDSATFVDLRLGYRLPKRWGIVEVNFQNILDQDYRYQGMQYRRAPPIGVPTFLPFPPEFTVLGRVTFAF